MITILIVTYDRPAEIRRTIDALREHIHYSGELRWHIADDGTPGNYIAELIRDYPTLKFTVTVTSHLGWGANVNKALQHTQMSDLIFLCEDDYVATRSLDFDAGAALLTTHTELGIVRYDGIVGHNGLNLWLREAKTEQGVVPYLKIDRNQSTHLNIYSNRPHLRHRRLHDALGLYSEGVSLGITEEGYAHRVLDKKDALGFAVLLDGLWNAFDHIGKSRQGTELDSNFRVSKE